MPLIYCMYLSGLHQLCKVSGMLMLMLDLELRLIFALFLMAVHKRVAVSTFTERLQPQIHVWQKSLQPVRNIMAFQPDPDPAFCTTVMEKCILSLHLSVKKSFPNGIICGNFLVGKLKEQSHWGQKSVQHKGLLGEGNPSFLVPLSFQIQLPW